MDWSKPPAPPQRPKPELVDEGFELVYLKLSNRRRFWRTIYMLPVCAVLFLVPEIYGAPGWQVGIVCAVVALTQAGYEYWKWQQDIAIGR